jgi:hypothetical protein
LRKEHEALRPVQTLAEKMKGRHVCILAEQGLGDELFFLRFLPLLTARGARVSYRPGRKLRTLLNRVTGLNHVIAPAADLPGADEYTLAGDIPHALGEWASMPRPDAGMHTDSAFVDSPRRSALFWPSVPAPLRIEALPQCLAQLRERLAQLGPPPYIGITWRAGTAPEQQAGAAWQLYKSIALPTLASALKHAKGTLVALQRNPRAGEIATLSDELKRTVHDLTAVNEDLESMLALLALIDEYIGVSNTNMHLRAAAGRTARVLVPAPAEWRWMQHGRTSPWFPGFSIYRQSLQGDWTRAIEALRHDLESALQAKE